MRHRVKRALRITVTLLVLGALAVDAVLLVQRKKAALAQAPRYGQAPMPVHVAKARTGSLELKQAYLAVVEPFQRANLSARLTSRVESVSVDEGQPAKADRPLILLDDQEIANSIAVAQTQIAQARAELAANEATRSALEKSAAFWAREANRVKGLLPQGAATVSEADAARDKADQLAGQLAAAKSKSDALRQQVAVLMGRVEELNTRKGYCAITSPFPGTVAHRHVDPGDLAVPGKTLLVVEDCSRLKLAFDIPQRDVPLIRAGMTVRFGERENPRTATVTNLFPSLNQARMLRAEVVLEGTAATGLDCGSYMPTTVVLRTRKDVTLVPTSAVVESPTGQSHVFIVQEGKLRPARVELLGRSGDESAVGGLAPGTEVVLSTFLGWSRLSAGLAVEAIR